MKTRRIGQLEVSVVGLGTNNFGTEFFGNRCSQDDAVRVVRGAIDAGVNFIDTAEEYSIATPMGTGHSEEILRVALGRHRDEVVIATKFLNSGEGFPDQHGAERIVRALEGSLQRLGTDRVDLYQQHRPDPGTPIEETLEALDRLVRDGKVREIGCANFSGVMIDEAQAVSREHGFARLVSAQNQYNVLDQPRQVGVIDACTQHAMMLLPYYPLASGVLTGKYLGADGVPADSRLGGDTEISRYMRKRLLSDDRLATVARLDGFATERGHTLLELAISWLTSQPVVASVIAGAVRPEQIVANAAAASWELSSEDFEAIATIAASASPR